MTGPAFSVAFPALGTTAVLLIADPDSEADADAAVRTVKAQIAAVDAACSRFREDSELMRLNAADGVAMVASPLLLDALEIAVRAARLTDGLVDPTVGSVMRILGYDRDFADVAATGPPLQVSVGEVPGWRAVVIDRAAGTVRVPGGVSVDLGATAKAWCADQAAARASAATGSGVLVSLGGDLAVAGSPPEGGWRVRVTDRHDGCGDPPGQTVAVTSGGLATSGTSARRWQRGGQQMHHIVDPATGQSANGPWRTASVAAASCVDANTASTAAIILGGRAPAWLEALGLAARLVGTDGAAVYTCGWPEEHDS